MRRADRPEHVSACDVTESAGCESGVGDDQRARRNGRDEDRLDDAHTATMRSRRTSAVWRDGSPGSERPCHNGAAQQHPRSKGSRAKPAGAATSASAPATALRLRATASAHCDARRSRRWCVRRRGGSGRRGYVRSPPPVSRAGRAQALFDGLDRRRDVVEIVEARRVGGVDVDATRERLTVKTRSTYCSSVSLPTVGSCIRTVGASEATARRRHPEHGRDARLSRNAADERPPELWSIP
jgi:hypothetical protein